MPQNAIQIINVTKIFIKKKKEGSFNFFLKKREKIVAVDNVSLEIKKGEIFALLGRNGAGKTTLLKMISTLLEPDTGKIFVSGYDTKTQSNQVKKSIGVMVGNERSLYWKLTGRENLEYFSKLYYMPYKVAKDRINSLFAFVGLKENEDVYVENYSSGMKYKLNFIKALLHNPEILLLDEPTLGLDPESAKNIRNMIRDLSKKEKKTILLTTHNMEEAQVLADRVGIIDKGKIVACDSPQNLINKLKLKIENPNLENVFIYLTSI